MLAVSINAALGRGAILLGLLTCLSGVAVTIAGIRRHDLRALKSSVRYAYVAFSRRCWLCDDGTGVDYPRLFYEVCPASWLARYSSNLQRDGSMERS